MPRPSRPIGEAVAKDRAAMKVDRSFERACGRSQTAECFASRREPQDLSAARTEKRAAVLREVVDVRRATSATGAASSSALGRSGPSIIGADPVSSSKPRKAA